jgi:hypothetical protein
MITICGNVETLSDSIDRDFDNSIRHEAAESIDAKDLATLAGEAEFEISKDFKDWHGGRFAEQAKMYGNRVYGHVAYQRDDEQAAAEQIDNALDSLLNARAAEIKKSWDAAESE